MICFIVLTALAAIAQARPEAGYSYSAPSGNINAAAAFSSQSQASWVQDAPSALSNDKISSDFQGFGNNGDLGYSGPNVVHKHVYVHVAPQEQEEVRAPKYIPTARPEKHYKIIFIKAPAPPKPVAPVIPVQPQNEEKTLVYVLVKKPEEQPDIIIPTPAPTLPSKPEVFFIKYKTTKAEGQTAGWTGPGALSGNGASLESGIAGFGHQSNLVEHRISSSQGAADGVSSKYGPPSHK